MIKASDLEEVRVIPTGLFVDNLSGLGGLPIGKLTEFWGVSGTGKSTLALQIIANAQKQDFKCLWIDAEYAYDTLYASKLGVDNTKLDMIRERKAEVILDMVLDEVLDNLEKHKDNNYKKHYDLVVLDSVGALTVKADLEKNLNEGYGTGQAVLMARFCRKVVPLLELRQTAFLAINHCRTDFNTGHLIPKGGGALKYHKSFSIRFFRKANEALKQGDRKIGETIILEVEKNRWAGTKWMRIESHLLNDSGFSKSADALQLAIDKGIVTKKGNTLFLGETRLGVGLQQARKTLEASQELQDKIKGLL